MHLAQTISRKTAKQKVVRRTNHEHNRPTENKWWREKVRQICGMHFVRVDAGEYALDEELGGIAV